MYSSCMIEVEVKAQVEPEVEEKLLDIGAYFMGSEDHVDIYYNPPGRDFAKSDEALRIRCGSKIFLTYKGPKIENVSKTRREVEVEVMDSQSMDELLKAIGFREVGKVVKRRKGYRVEEFKVFLDSVVGLGTFLEIEAYAMSQGEIGEKVLRAFRLLEKIGVPRSAATRESYLEMLLKASNR